MFYRLLKHSATPRVLNPIKHIFGDPGAKLSPKNIALSRLVAPGSPRMNKTLLLVFNHYGKSSWVISKVVAVAYECFSIFALQSLSHSVQTGFHKNVVTRAGRLREWSQGELRLY